MFNWLKDWLNPTPYNSTTTFECNVPMPKVKAPKVEGVSEPVIAILKSMHQRSRDWKIRQTKLDNNLDHIYEIVDKKSGFSFEITSCIFDVLDISIKYQTLEWMTWREQRAIATTCRDLYLKRISRLQAIQSVTEKKKTDKVRNYWKEKYQC